MPEFRLTKHATPYMLHGRFDIGAPKAVALKEAIKVIPGVHYVKNEWNVKSWEIPLETVPQVITLARKFGFDVTDMRTLCGPSPVTLFNDLGKFEPFQKPDIERALHELKQTNAWLVAYAMGLGKTPVGIELCRQLQNQAKIQWRLDHPTSSFGPDPMDILIICPAMAREVWLHGNGPEFKDNGFARWWPERFSRGIHRGREYPVEPFSILSSGEGPRGLQRWLTQTAADGGDSGTLRRGKVVVCSYGILRSLLEALGTDATGLQFNPRVIILDEAHYISNKKSAQSKAVFDASYMFPDAYRLALTGTPLTNPDDLEGLHTVLSWLWPDRFGTAGSFKFYYMNPIEVFDSKDNFRGHKYKGLNEDHKEELRARLASCSSRLTKKDVAHLLPPFSCSLVPFDGDRTSNASDLAVSLLQQGHSHVRVACYHHATADKLVTALRKGTTKNGSGVSGVGVFQVDGRETPEQRTHILASARSSHKSITVATISSTKVAIDLTFQTASVYAELSFKVEAVLQNLGRGHRASSVRGHDVFILADETGDSVAQALYRKATILSDVLAAGTEETALTETIGALKEKGASQEEIDKMLSLLSYGEE